MNNNNDIDMAIQALATKKEQNEKQGKTNKKKDNYDIIQQKQEHEQKVRAEVKKQKDLEKKYQNKEKDYEVFEQVSPEILNKLHEAVDYGV